MNNRLTTQDVANLLAARTGKDRKSAELFLREFIAALSDGVCTDKIVKVKGFGTFKVVLVEKRESIHVNTGERFLIPQHYKFSFLPDKDLRELVNKPFSFFETTELNENVDFSDIDERAEAEEKDIEDESVEELMPEREVLIVEEAPVVDEESLVEPIKAPVEELVEVPIEPSVEAPIEEPAEGVFASEPEQKPGVNPTVKYLIAAVVVVVVVFIASFYADKRLDVVSTLNDNVVVAEPVVVADTLHNATTTPDSVATTPVPPAPKVLTKLKIEHGSRLTVIALEYYGSKVFWVYLYEYNKDVIGDPNNIPVGTEISVPAPEIYGINARDKASIAKAAALQTELLSGKL